MTRLGFYPQDVPEAVKYISLLPNIFIEGVYTQLSSADEADRAYTDFQLEKTREAFSQIEDAGVAVKIKHAANSAAAIMYPDSYLDMVRIGISLYGCWPSEDVDKTRIDLRPAKQLKTQIIRLSEVPPGIPVSYGRHFVTKRPSRIATIPIGYADGISRVLAGKLVVLVSGQIAPVVGRICMDQCMVDITDVKGDVNLYDEVVIYGAQNGVVLPVEQIAEQMGTINYEMLCLTSGRVPVYYIENGKIVSMVDYLGARSL
jgi:alanine racemase